MISCINNKGILTSMMESVLRMLLFFNRKAQFLIILFFLPSIEVFGQDVKFESLFFDILNYAPDTLSLSYLKQIPKFRYIHHDSFNRGDTIPYDKKTGQLLRRYSLGSEELLGKNSFQDELYFDYQMLSNYPIIVGIKDDSLVYNKATKNRKNRMIAYVDAKRRNYGFMFKRSDNKKSDAKIAFNIEDINNMYYVRADTKNLELHSLIKGCSHRIFRKKHNGGSVFYVLINDSYVFLYSDYQYIGKVPLDFNQNSTLCGMLFTGDVSSEIDDFVINYLESYEDNLIDNYIEKAKLSDKQISWGCEEGLITYDTVYKNNSLKSLRFELDYYDDWEEHKIGFSRRTEIRLKSKRAASLDTWIYSFDVLFPGINEKDEYYANDDLGELFWQMHAPSNINMLSPNVGLYMRNGIVRFQSYSRSELRYDRIGVKSNWDYNKDGYVAVLVDKFSVNPKLLELIRGEWHNFTIYVKEGYTYAQLPRTILYVDGKKAIDWFIPNVQNCGFPPAYMLMGIYKWSWAQTSVTSDVKKRVLYYDNIIYIR